MASRAIETKSLVTYQFIKHTMYFNLEIQ